MLMKQLSLVVCTLMLASIVQAQTVVPSESPAWTTYSIRNEDFSVQLPIHPAMHTSSIYNQRVRKSVKIYELGAYADGIAYTVYVLEDPSPQQSLDEFVRRRTRGQFWDQAAASDIKVDGFAGRALTYVDRGGMAQFLASEDRLYEFVAFGVGEIDSRVKKFFSSVSLKNKKDSVEVSNGYGVAYEPVSEPAATTPDAEPLTGKQVNHKALLAMKPEPSYTESARRNQVTGTVVLKCIFSKNGSVTSIRIVSELPDGLTEKAIDAAKKIKFIPARKDGKYVSMWMQLEYNFNLY